MTRVGNHAPLTPIQKSTIRYAARRLDRKEADNDFNLDRDLSLPLKSVSPDQPPGWNDPYRMLEFWGSLMRRRLQPLIACQIMLSKRLDVPIMKRWIISFSTPLSQCQETNH